MTNFPELDKRVSEPLGCDIIESAVDFQLYVRACLSSLVFATDRFTKADPLTIPYLLQYEWEVADWCC